jgi:hypothetical protein
MTTWLKTLFNGQGSTDERGRPKAAREPRAIKPTILRKLGIMPRVNEGVGEHVRTRFHRKQTTVVKL